MRTKADEFVELIGPYCERIEIAGSIRRQREDVGDIEIVAIPRIEQRELPGSLFEPKLEDVDMLHEFCLQLRRDNVLEDRLSVAGSPSFGPKSKRCLFRGFPLDLFSVHDPLSWGYILALRTGPGELNKQLMQDRPAGYRPMGLHMESGLIHDRGVRVDTSTEEQFFALFDLPCLPPEHRGTLVKGGMRGR